MRWIVLILLMAPISGCLDKPKEVSLFFQPSLPNTGDINHISIKRIANQDVLEVIWTKQSCRIIRIEKLKCSTEDIEKWVSKINQVQYLNRPKTNTAASGKTSILLTIKAGEQHWVLQGYRISPDEALVVVKKSPGSRQGTYHLKPDEFDKIFSGFQNLLKN